MERKKKCRYCEKEFTAKRIDARYCSPSCRQMGYRRESNPDVYGKVVPIFFDLDAKEYEKLLLQADEAGIHPNDYAKEFLLRKEDNYLKIYFEDDEWAWHLDGIEGIFQNETKEEVIKKWIIERARIEIY